MLAINMIACDQPRVASCSCGLQAWSRVCSAFMRAISAHVETR